MPLPRRVFLLVAAVFVVTGCTVASADTSHDDGRAAGDGLVESTATTTKAIAPPASTTTATTVTTTTTTTTTTLPAIVLGFAGDTSFTHGLDTRDPLGDVTDLLHMPDLMVVNLETTIAEPDVGSAQPKKYTFKSPPRSVGILGEAGIDAVQLANNHTLDFGRPALLRTLELLDAGDVPYAGAGADAAAAYAPRYLDVDGWRIALVAFSRVPCGWAESGENTRPEVAWTCPAFVADTIAAVEEAAGSADLVVVLVHWGIELDHCPQPYQRELATAWERVGADIVIGGHPHVLQGVEKIGNAWLVNSTGNFAFPSARQSSSYSALFEFRVGPDGTDLVAHPIRIVDGRPRPASDADAASILEDLGRWSVGWTFDETGTAVASDTRGVCSR